MKRILVLIVLLITPQVAFAGASVMTAPQGATVRKKAPKGVVIRKNRARLKSGYRFVRKAPNLVVVESIQGRQDAKFSCKCEYDEGGSCEVQTNGLHLFCNGCGKCSLKVTLEPTSPVRSSSNSTP